MNNKYLSPLEIDLGAKNTGYGLTHYPAAEALQPQHTRAGTMVIHNDKMTLSQQSRRKCRHRLRNRERGKMVKRLLRLAVMKLLENEGISLDQKSLAPAWEGLCGLMNRRGYNRVETEMDEAVLDNCEPDFFAEHLPDYFSDSIPLADQWHAILQQPEMISELHRNTFFASESKKPNDSLLSAYKKPDQAVIKKAWLELKKSISSFVYDRDSGHKHRNDYLKYIREEIGKDSRLKPITDVIGIEPLWSLVGNISNLQLRCARWYFDDAEMKEADIWKPEKLTEVLIRWLDYWRPGSTEEKERQKQSKAVLSETEDVLTALTLLDPHHSVPPYENQNNRRPPKDQTLWLSPAQLNLLYPNWLLWAQKLRMANPGWDENIHLILKYTDRKARLPRTENGQRIEPSTTKEQLQHSYLLQRLLDRSLKIDPYLLRRLARNETSQKLQDAKAKLCRDLGSQHIESFLRFCGDYYAECDLAKQGLWLRRESNLLEAANLNPPQKNKILHSLAGAILGEELDKPKLAEFRAQLWKQKQVKSGTTLQRQCQTIEELRKNYGNLFNEKLKRLEYRVVQGKVIAKKLTGEDKKLWAILNRTKRCAELIAKHYRHTKEQKQKYSNPFRMAELYNLLETDRHGFSRTTLAAHLENAWRMQMVEDNNAKSARCSRLTADSVRPLDGFLRKGLDRLAEELARLKAEQIMYSDKTCNSEIMIPILIEENRFAFTQELYELKDSPKKKRDLAQKNFSSQKVHWQEKNQRIKDASRNICPYTGEDLYVGEIDHIISRSSTQGAIGTVFNSQANLIWCSNRGNNQKLKFRYTLNDLHPRYRNAVFQTANPEEIEVIINKLVAALPNEFIFDSLDDAGRDAVRHALFLDNSSPAFQKVLRSLGTQNKSRVNGTQAWLVRSIMQKLDSMLKDWALEHHNTIKFTARRISAEDTSRVRAQLGEWCPQWKKQDRQSVVSHAIDALCVLAVAAAQPDLVDVLQQGALLSEDMKMLNSVIPESFDILQIQRKTLYRKDEADSRPLFKEGIYGENFLPVWVKNGSIKIGFDPFKTLTYKGETDAQNEHDEPLTVEGSKPEIILHMLKPLLNDAEKVDTALNDKCYRRFTVNKSLAIAHLHKVAKQPCDEDDLQLADLLDALHYLTAKQNVKSRIFDDKKKLSISEADILKKNSFKIKADFSLKSGKLVQAKFKGDLVLPSRLDWQRFVLQNDLKAQIGTDSVLPDEAFRKLCTAFFKINPEKQPRDKIRKEFSLPIVHVPAGGYRIRRKDPNKEYVWQVHVVAERSTIGFAVKDGVIDWKNEIKSQFLERSNSISELGGRWNEPPAGHISVDEWLVVRPEGSTEVSTIELAPGTKNRFYVRITQSFSQFQDWCKGATKNLIAPHSIDSSMKVDGKVFSSNAGIKCIGTPRGNLFVAKIGSEIKYQYEMLEKRYTSARDAYQNAYTAQQNHP